MIKNSIEIEKMRVAGSLASKVRIMIEKHVKPGISTEELDDICHNFIINDLDCIPAPLNYRGFPKSICTSINHQVCHGIPDKRILKKQDILNIDVTVIKDGYHGDTSKMFFIGKPSIQAKRLVELTYDALKIGIKTVKPGATIGDIGHNIQVFAEKNIVYDYIDITNDEEATKKAIELNNGMRRIPVIVFQDQSILVEPNREELIAKLG